MPPHGEETLAAGRVDVDKARKVAGDAFFRKGHMALDCRRTASMVIHDGIESVKSWVELVGGRRKQYRGQRQLLLMREEVDACGVKLSVRLEDWKGHRIISIPN